MAANKSAKKSYSSNYSNLSSNSSKKNSSTKVNNDSKDSATASNQQSTFSFWSVAQILATIGIGLAIYLFYSYLSPQPPTLCEINATINCEAVTKGPLAEWFGIPVSLVGLVGYVVILYAAISKKLNLFLAMVTFGMLFCLRLTFLEIFVEEVLCPVCLLCQLIMATLFGMGLHQKYKK